MTNLTELYERLKEEQAQLNNDLKHITANKTYSADGRQESSSSGKKEDEATEAFELEKNLALEKQLTDALAEVEHALGKYEAGTYSICDSCGQPIEPARLEALPQASLCLNCKTHQTKDARNKTAS